MLNAVSPVDVHISYNHTGEFKTKNGKKNTNANQKKAKGLSPPQCLQALGVGVARDRSQRKIQTGTGTLHNDKQTGQPTKKTKDS